MSPNDDYFDDDAFDQALSEYHERTWDPADFADLPTDVQSEIVERAIQLRAANDRLRDLRAA
jgi:hypothetical protein